MKKIWIINHYAGETFFDHGGRHYWFAKYLKKKGYKPVVFVCNAKHGVKDQWIETKDLWTEKQADEIGVPYVFVYAPTYEGNGKDRIVNMVSFYRNVQKAGKQYAKLHGKPDVIIASSVHPLTLVAGIKLAKHFGIKCISEVRDLWPESIFAYSGRIKNNSLFGKLLYRGERWIYKKSDALIFTMAGGVDYIKEHGWDREHGGPIDLDKVFHINNGVDLKQFDYNLEHYQIEDPDLEDPNIFKVVYTGSIRKVNNLGLLLDTAKRVNDSNIRFFIWGDGDELDALKRRVQDENINNVIFKGRVDKKCVPYIVSHADLNIAHNTPSSLHKYGISMNKVFDYLAAGKPMLSDFPCVYNPSIQNNAGFEVAVPDAKSIAREIERIRSMPETELINVGKNARNAAEQQFDFRVLTQKLIEIIEK
jgi:glycosyltransferase involved in cell wall biosynthesis